MVYDVTHRVRCAGCPLESRSVVRPAPATAALLVHAVQRARCGQQQLVRHATVAYQTSARPPPRRPTQTPPLRAALQESFDHVREWLKEVDRYASPDTCKLLIGNKSDRSDKVRGRASERERARAALVRPGPAFRLDGRLTLSPFTLPFFLPTRARAGGVGGGGRAAGQGAGDAVPGDVRAHVRERGGRLHPHGGAAHQDAVRGARARVQAAAAAAPRGCCATGHAGPTRAAQCCSDVIAAYRARYATLLPIWDQAAEHLSFLRFPGHLLTLAAPPPKRRRISRPSI
jgi:hypothetical protein